MSDPPNRSFDFDVSRRPELPRTKGLFVTGTDTGVGKTLIAGAIARSLLQRGLDVGVFKPVATGCRRSGEQLVSEDAEFLAACAGSKFSPAEVAPVRFSAALAPNVAAEREGRQIDLEAIFTAYARICSRAEVVVVEAIGGLLCPISNDFWVVHLAAMMKLPVVIVARASLGTINHTLLTIHAARTAALEVAGVVVNRSAGEARCADDELAMLTNPSQIEARGNVPVLAVVPEEAANSVAEGHIGIATQLAIDRVDWESITGLPARSPRRPGG